MKKIILVLATITSLYACKKDQVVHHTPENNNVQVMNASIGTLSSIPVDTYGVLRFTNEAEVNDYIAYILQLTPDSVINWQQSLGYTSKAYGNTYQLIDESNVFDFVVNANECVGLGNNILKFTADDNYILTINNTNVNQQNMNNLISGTYNNSTMNRFYIHMARTAFSWSGTLNQYPYGLDEYTPSGTPQVLRKFWGYEEECSEECMWIGGPKNKGVRNCWENAYFFWIVVDVRALEPEECEIK